MYLQGAPHELLKTKIFLLRTQSILLVGKFQWYPSIFILLSLNIPGSQISNLLSMEDKISFPWLSNTLSIFQKKVKIWGWGSEFLNDS